MNMILNFTKIFQLNREIDSEFVILEGYMKKRWDLIPRLIENTRKSQQYSKDILESIILVRNATYRIMSKEKKVYVDNVLNSNIDKLFKSFEKGDKNMGKLRDDLIELGMIIENFKINYNEKIEIYNNRIERFPYNLISGMFKCRKKELLF